MNILGVGRVAAVVVSVSTFVFLFLHDSWRSDNQFLVPDLVLYAVRDELGLPSLLGAVGAVVVALLVAGRRRVMSAGGAEP